MPGILTLAAVWPARNDAQEAFLIAAREPEGGENPAVPLGRVGLRSRRLNRRLQLLRTLLDPGSHEDRHVGGGGEALNYNIRAIRTCDNHGGELADWGPHKKPQAVR